MDKIRRKFKADELKYKDINKTIDNRRREARVKWICKKCSEIEA